MIYEQRDSDSPYVETVTHGHTLSDGSTIRPAECHWHLVLVKHDRQTKSIVVGPLSNAGRVAWAAGAEILWIKFRLGTFMPHLPIRHLLDSETMLPEAANHAFWLHSAAWQFPDVNNVDTFIDRLARDEVLVRDPLVSAVLQDRPHQLSPRTIRHRFLRATGLTHSRIRQIQRARRAAALLQQGHTILDTIDELGYFDQPHLTRALRQWVGHTPARIGQSGAPD
jgi:AraC-like DNA-binding protein